MDVAHVSCGADRWGDLVAVNERHDRDVFFGFRFDRKGPGRAIDSACTDRFVVVGVAPGRPIVRSDNCLIFEGRRFHEASRL